MDLSELKKEYAKLEKKHKLPVFKKLNEDFEIEKISQDTECLLRVVRKAMFDKVVNAISFLEMLLNPMNAPRMYLPFIKSMTSGDSKKIDELYGKLAELSLASLALELGYDEKKEAALIIKTFKDWNTLKSDLGEIISKVEKPNSTIAKKERSYFG